MGVFRDEREAAMARVEELERENAALKAVAQERAGPPRARRRLFPLVLGVVMAAGALGGVFAWLFMARAAPPPREGALVRLGFQVERAGPRAVLGVTAVSDGVWAVGEGGWIGFRSERGWQTVPSGTEATLRAVTQSSAGQVFAVGARGTIVRFDSDARRWVPETSGVTEDLRAIACNTMEACVIAGARGVLLLSNGSRATPRQWERVATVVTADLAGVTFYNGGTFAAVVGGGGVVLRVADGAAVVQASGTDVDLYGVATDGNELLAVGAQGTVLRASTGSDAPWRVERIAGASFRTVGVARVEVDWGGGGSMGTSLLLVGDGASAWVPTPTSYPTPEPFLAVSLPSNGPWVSTTNQGTPGSRALLGSATGEVALSNGR
ncbi:MAG: hypothetical protein HY909_12080 [Deltaproteobacteria bacterium]|nr:hypothetical protein [Deltaproteobacteria bacterium]